MQLISILKFYKYKLDIKKYKNKLIKTRDIMKSIYCWKKILRCSSSYLTRKLCIQFIYKKNFVCVKLNLMLSFQDFQENRNLSLALYYFCYFFFSLKIFEFIYLLQKMNFLFGSHKKKKMMKLYKTEENFQMLLRKNCVEIKQNFDNQTCTHILTDPNTVWNSSLMKHLELEAKIQIHNSLQIT
jgi:hypothetical protein